MRPLAYAERARTTNRRNSERRHNHTDRQRPYLIQGNVALLDAEGNRFEAGDTVALCRCGQSNTKPFCDGTHERVDFAAASRAEQLLAR